MIEIEVGKSRYKIRCRPEEQDRLFALARKLNERVNNLAMSSREGEERTLLIMLALLFEDEVDELKTKVTESERKLTELPEVKAISNDSSNFSAKPQEDIFAENHLAANCKLCDETLKTLESAVSSLEELANKIR